MKAIKMGIIFFLEAKEKYAKSREFLKTLEQLRQQQTQQKEKSKDKGFERDVELFLYLMFNIAYKNNSCK